MTVTSLGFPLAAVLVSVVAGGAASVLAWRLVAPFADRLGAQLLIVVLNLFVCSPVFQIAYTESLALALLLATLIAFQQRRTALTAGLVLLLSLTRAVVLPLAAVFVLFALLRWRRGSSRSALVTDLALGVWALATTFLWPAIAGFVTGEPKAYLLTQAGWNPVVATLPVVRFVERVAPDLGGPAGAIAIVVFWTALLVWLVTHRQPSPLVRLWSGIYTLYLLAAVDWNPTALRYYLLAIPAVWAPVRADTQMTRRSRILVIAGVAVVGLATQWWWIRYSLTVSPEHQQLP